MTIGSWVWDLLTLRCLLVAHMEVSGRHLDIGIWTSKKDLEWGYKFMNKRPFRWYVKPGRVSIDREEMGQKGVVCVPP